MENARPHTPFLRVLSFDSRAIWSASVHLKMGQLQIYSSSKWFDGRHNFIKVQRRCVFPGTSRSTQLCLKSWKTPALRPHYWEILVSTQRAIWLRYVNDNTLQLHIQQRDV